MKGKNTENTGNGLQDEQRRECPVPTIYRLCLEILSCNTLVAAVWICHFRKYNCHFYLLRSRLRLL